jgi:phenylacetate-coenzyme A ligase PaaK-like adenylate-forming protein
MTAVDTTTATDVAGWEAFREQVQRRLFASMDGHIGRLTWGADRIEEFQRERLRDLLATAIERSPFHRRRLAGTGIDPATFEIGELAALPTMTKEAMMAEFDAVATDRRVTLAAAERAIGAATSIPRLIAGDLLVLASGGSSGRRGLFVFDAEGFAEYTASLLRPMMARLRSVGGPPPGGLHGAIVAADSAIHATGVASVLLEGSPITLTPLPVTLPLDVIVARLNALQPMMLVGYPSMLARLAHERCAGRLSIQPSAITAGSETLRDDQRRDIADAFGVPVANTYGASEGLVGASRPGERAISFATDCCVVELVDDDDRPVPPGATSSAILVTNLFNRVQPLIRYRIDDRVVQLPPVPEHGHLVGEVQGRSGDVLHFGDVSIHPLVVASPLEKDNGVVNYQVRQTPEGVDISVTTTRAVDTRQLAEHVRQRLVDAGLDDPRVAVDVVADVMRDPRTSKAPVFIPRR